MKRLVTALLALALFVAPQAMAEDDLQIACLIRGGSEYWQNVERGVKAAAEAAKAQLQVMYIAGLENTLDHAAAISIAAIAGADIILTSYNEREGFAEAISEAREMGILVVYMDTDGPRELRDIYVGVDHVAAGREMGDAMLESLNPGDHALLCVNPYFINLQNQSRLAEGVEAAFADSDCVLEFFYDNINVDFERQTELDSYIKEHEEVRGIFSFSQLQTRGYVQLMEGASWKDRVRLVGLDYQTIILPYIQDGSIYAILEKNPRLLGQEAARVAIEAYVSGVIAAENVIIDHTILNSENIDEYLMEE